MRLLLLTTTSDIGGMPRVTTGLARQFAGRGAQVQYVFPHQPGERERAWYEEQGIDVGASAVAPHLWLRRNPSDLLAMWRFVRRSGASVVNIHYGDDSISLKDLVLLRLAGRHRCVVSVHHPTAADGLTAHRRRMTGVASLLADDVVVVSAASRASLLASGVPARKITIILNGVLPPATLPTREAARARLGLPVDAFVVGALARLVPHKGIANLLGAAALVPDPEGALHVLIAGDGPERDALATLGTTSLGTRAHLLGHLADTADFYAALDVFALPSYMEGFGLVYVEAAFHGVPSIGTTAGGTPEAILQDETGLLVPPGDISALAGAIRRLRDDPTLRRRLGDAAQARAAHELTEDAMADRYARLYAPNGDPARGVRDGSTRAGP